MNRLSRPGLTSLLAVFVVSASVLVAHASTITYTVTLNWPSGIVPPTTSGMFTLTVNPPSNGFSLDNYSINTPQLGLFQSGLAGQFGSLFVPPECPGNTCFEIQLQMPFGSSQYSVLSLFFGGSIYNFHGGSILPSITTPTGGLIFSRLACADPCIDVVSGVAVAPTPPVPEPASMMLFGAGLLASVSILRKRLT